MDIGPKYFHMGRRDEEIITIDDELEIQELENKQLNSTSESDNHHITTISEEEEEDNPYSTTTNREHQSKRGPILLKRSRKWFDWIFSVIATFLIFWVITSYLFLYCLPIIFNSSITTNQRILHVVYFIIFSFISTLVLYPYYKCTFTHPGIVFKDDKDYALTKEQVEKYKKKGVQFIQDLEREIDEVMNYRKKKEEERNGEIREKVDNNTTINNSTGTNNEMSEEGSDDENRPMVDDTIELSSRGRVRVCEKCWIRKPDRAHHCRQLNACVLKMDHYCPWFANCIGFYNYKYFCLFLCWTSMGGFFVNATMSNYLFKNLSGNQSNNGYRIYSFIDVNLIIVYVFSFCFAFALLFFAVYHFKLILFNTTTIESMGERRFYEQYGCHPYDIGFLYNIKSVLGNNPLTWLSPFHDGVQGDGVRFLSKVKHNNVV